MNGVRMPVVVTMLHQGEECAMLPPRDRLLVALCCDTADEHPVCRHARELVHIHRARRERPVRAAEYDVQRAELVIRIREWVQGNIPASGQAASLRPEAVADLVDRVAAAAETAMHVLQTCGACNDRMHTVWTRLGELELEYSDLITNLQSRRTTAAPPYRTEAA